MRRVLLLVFIAIRSLLSSKLNDRALQAEFHHDTAIKYAGEGNYDEALAHFRAACRCNNLSALFQNDLGVTEMRMGQYYRAIRRFESALSLDSTWDIPNQNLKELKGYMTPKEFRRGTHRRHEQLHQRLPLPLLTINELTSQPSNTQQNMLMRPFLIKNFTQNWSSADLMSLDQITSLFGHHRVDYYPHNMLEEQAHPFFATMSDAVRQMFSWPDEAYRDVDASQPGTYIQWNIDEISWREVLRLMQGSVPGALDDEWWTRQCFPSLADTVHYDLSTHWKMLLIGEAGAGMFNHKDYLKAPAWQIQLQGRKRWHLCSPREDRRMYKAGQVDAFNPDYNTFPKFRQVRECFEGVLQAGDLIYYPTDYWHQTLNMDTPSVALSSTVVTRDSHTLVKDMLQQECRGAGKIFYVDPKDYDKEDQEDQDEDEDERGGGGMCSQLRQCYSVWRYYFHQTDGEGREKESEGGAQRGHDEL